MAGTSESEIFKLKCLAHSAIQLPKACANHGLSAGFYNGASITAPVFQRILKLGGTTSSMLFPVQCHLGTLSQTCSPWA